MHRQTHSRRARPATRPTLLTTGLVLSLAIIPGTCAGRQAPVERRSSMSETAVVYEARTPMPGDACTPLKATLEDATLAPGTYCFDSGALLTGELTLDGPAEGTWDFQVGTSGIGALIGKDLTVRLRGGALPCRITWWVADEVRMNGSAFQGTVLAGGPITLVGGSFVGHTWSKGEVTVTGTTVRTCDGPRLATWRPTQSCGEGLGNTPEGCIAVSAVPQSRQDDNETGGGTGYAGRR